MTPTVLALLFIAGAIAVVLIRLDAERSERSRKRVRNMYAKDSPLWIRNGYPLLPLWAPGMVLFSLAALIPRSVALVPVYPALVLVQAAFLLSYRVPAPFMPGWLRDEIVGSVTPVARPDRLDWLLFWIVLPVIILGDIGFLTFALGWRLS